MSLYKKYRPSTLEEVIGNEEVVQSLETLLSNVATFPHAVLLTGPTGCGKTTFARIIANRLGSTEGDYREIDSADFRGIETVRSVIRQSQFMPLKAERITWVIDECHKMTNDAQNALLKILEDTPPHVYFILCTTDPQKLLATIKGRCSIFEVKVLDETNMFRLLRSITRQEEERLPKVVYETIFDQSQGHPRNALQILEQVFSVKADLRLEIAKKAGENVTQSIQLCRSLIDRRGWRHISDILKGLKAEDPEKVRRHVLSYCQSILLNGDEERAGLIMEAFLEPFYNTGMAGLVFACYSIHKT